MFWTRAISPLLLVLTGALACTVNLSAPETLFPSEGPFVLRGTAALADNNGPCLIWIGENGITYHLFQSPHLDNELFDRITTPGTASRLHLSVREDLEVDCRMGTIVEVQEVLEIVE